jgi:cob(I)alamin adenosyltransferase
MAITTKTGDQGMTSLLFSGRVHKDDLRLEAYGTLDELSAFLGSAKSLVKDRTAYRHLLTSPGPLPGAQSAPLSR